MAKLHQPFTAKNQVMFIWEDEMQSKMCVVLGQSGWVMMLWAAGLLQIILRMLVYDIIMHVCSGVCVVLN